MSDRDITERLSEIAAMRPGADIPEWIGGPNNWATGVSTLCLQALMEINMLRVRVKVLEGARK